MSALTQLFDRRKAEQALEVTRLAADKVCSSPLVLTICRAKAEHAARGFRLATVLGLGSVSRAHAQGRKGARGPRAALWHQAGAAVTINVKGSDKDMLMPHVYPVSSVYHCQTAAAPKLVVRFQVERLALQLVRLATEPAQHWQAFGFQLDRLQVVTAREERPNPDG